jgi:death-on-curing protein
VKEPVWLLKQIVLACHAECIRLYGGSDGMRDEGLLESALARPEHQYHYQKADLCRLAAAYAAGIAKNHPFVDGNKRTAFMAATVFLERNGLRFTAEPAHAAVFIVALADGSLLEEGFAGWLRDNSRRVRASRPRTRRPKKR